MFCQWFLQHCGANRDFPTFIIFMDEARFTRDGIQNFHNHHLWADVILPSHYQQLFSINIWANICGGNLFGPHVLLNRPTGWNYEAFLETNVPNFLASMPLIVCRELHFVHDGNPTHFRLIHSFIYLFTP
jgi:hypothetical protein